MAGSLPRNRGNRSANRVGTTVSRRLRAAGHNVVSGAARLHCGLTVSGADGVATVSVDYGIRAKNDRVLGELIDTLASWDQVGEMDYETLPDGAVLLWVAYTPRER